MTSRDGQYSELPPPRVLRALGGDRAAFSELYRCYDPTVRTSVAAAIRFRADLVAHYEDIVSETWTRFLADGCKRLRSYDPERGPFGYYLRMRTFAMARMIAAQYVRRSKTVDLDDPLISLQEDALEGRLLSRDELERFHRAVVEDLGEVDLALFERVYVQGRTIVDVADQLGLTRDAAYRRSHRLKDKILRIARAVGVTRPRAGMVGLIALFALSSDPVAAGFGLGSEDAGGDPRGGVQSTSAAPIQGARP